MNRTIDLFIFDLAGTTVRDDGVVHGAFREVIDAARLDASDEWIRAHMGVYKLQVFRELLSLCGKDPSGAEAIASAFDDAIERRLRRSPPEPLPGALESMDALRRDGIKIAFTTGFGSTTADRYLARLGWAYDARVASDEVPRGRPAPDIVHEAMRRTGIADPARVGLAGDTPADLGAGAAAGCRFIVGVGHGTHTLEQLAPHPHTHLMNDLTMLPEVVRAGL